MKRNNFVLCLTCLVAMVSFSHVALGQTVTFSNTHIETNAKTSDGKSALKVHYDANVKGCYGHTIKIGLTITAGNGTYIVDSEENKGVGFTTQEIHYDNSKLSDRSIIVPYSKFKVYSGTNTYYYQLFAVDKVTGDYLGESYLTAFDMVGKSNSNSNSGNKTNKSTQPNSDNQPGKSEKKSQPLGAAAIILGEQMVTENSKDGSQLAYNLHYTLVYSLPKASNLKFLFGIYDDAYCSKPRKDKNGNAVVQEYIWKNQEKETGGSLNIYMGFDHDEINAEPGTHLYYLYIIVLDESTGEVLCQTGPWKFAANGDGTRVKDSEIPKDDSYKFFEDFDSLEEYERYMDDLYQQYLEERNSDSKANTNSNTNTNPNTNTNTNTKSNTKPKAKRPTK